MLNLVPLGRGGREVMHGERKTRFVCKRLQFFLPQSIAYAVGASAVGGDEEVRLSRIQSLPDALPPPSYGLYREGCGVVVGADVHEALVPDEV